MMVVKIQRYKFCLCFPQRVFTKEFITFIYHIRCVIVACSFEVQHRQSNLSPICHQIKMLEYKWFCIHTSFNASF